MSIARLFGLVVRRACGADAKNVGRFAGRSSNSLVVERLETRDVPSALQVNIDYTYDTSGFFSNPTTGAAAKAALQQAITDVASHVDGARLSAIAPSGSNTWSETFYNPATGNLATVANPSVAAGSITIYVGARSLAGGTEAGIGGFGGYTSNGSAGWNTTVQTRNASGFAPWGGSIAFDNSQSWYFGTSASGLGTNQVDFYSVAEHELGHVLGLGTSSQWNALISGNAFTGATAESAYGGAAPVASDHAHWADGTSVNGQRALMDPILLRGTRETLTALDSGALQDIGWAVPSVLVSSETVNGVTYQLYSNGVLYSAGAGGLTPLATQVTAIAATTTTGNANLFVLNSGDAVYLFNGSGFTQLATAVTQIAATQSDFFVLNGGNNVYHYQGGGFTQLASAVTQIAATQSDFFVLNGGNNVYHYQGGGFAQLASAVTQIAATQSDFFVLNGGNNVYHYQGGGFTQLASAVTQIGATQSQFFVLNSGNNLYYYQNGGFTFYVSNIIQISVAQSQLYILRNDGSVFSYNGGGFTQLPSPVISPATVTTLVAPTGDSIYVLGTDHKVYRYNPTTDAWSLYATNVTTLSLTSSGQLHTS